MGEKATFRLCLLQPATQAYFAGQSISQHKDLQPDTEDHRFIVQRRTAPGR